MELTTYIESLKSSLQTTAAPAGKDVADAAALLAQAIEPAARLCLLEALSRAADEITLHLHNTTVEARLHGQEVDFVVSELDAIEAKEAQPASADSQSNNDVARITLRLPEHLKDSVEQAAKSENLSVNGWLVGAIASAVVDGSDFGVHFRYGKRNRSYRGFARS
ncbi:MAG: hypothetical protein OSB68_00385 [Dehalococcoidia bacterium]|nr:hypothetical protein [Dehalococcoidia bacterium]